MKNKQRVNHGGLRHLAGTVTKSHRIRIDGKMQTVYSVKWDGNPTSIPRQWRDEDGSNKRGYLESDLVVK